MIYTYVATCLFGIEKVLGEEIDKLGYKRIETIDGRIKFAGDESAVSRCNIWLRTAERLYIEIGTTDAFSFEELYQNVLKMPWSDFIGKNDSFPVSGHSINSELKSIPSLQSVIQKAIAENLKKSYSVSILPAVNKRFSIEFFILKNKASLMIDISGTALHKRGYRIQSNDAPLRETIASALIYLSKPKDDILYWDPMCGSGTIPIEASMIFQNIAPGSKRSFISEDLCFPDSFVWRQAREEAKDVIINNITHLIYSSDIDEKSLRIAKNNIKRAGVSDYISLFKMDLSEVKTEGKKGTVICNPPYGERMSTVKETLQLYKKMGETFRKLDNWQIYVLTSNETFEKYYGQRADKIRKIYNGMIKCNFYQFYKKHPDKQ